jgi:hypothetical protein
MPPSQEYDRGRLVRQSLLQASEALHILGKPDRVRRQLNHGLRHTRKVRAPRRPLNPSTGGLSRRCAAIPPTSANRKLCESSALNFRGRRQGRVKRCLQHAP